MAATAQAFSLDPAGRQPRGFLGRAVASPALARERVREFPPLALTTAAGNAPSLLPAGSPTHPGDRATGLSAIASLALHLIVAGAVLAAFGAETMGGGGQSAEQGGGIAVELVTLAPAQPRVGAQPATSADAEPAQEDREAAAPLAEVAPRQIVLPPRPVDAEAFTPNFPPPPEARKAKPERTADRPIETPRPMQARREAAKPAPAKAKAPAVAQQPMPTPAAPSAPADTARVADTAASSAGQQLKSGATGAPAPAGAGGDRIAAVGGAGTRIAQARFKVTPPPPPYPRRAVAQRQEGVVTIRALIGESGEARQIKLQASSGYPLLDKAALQAVAEWQFAPETIDGRPVAVWVEVPVRFRID